ncbi:MAG: dihydroxy-acid dehydratase [Verrucomicrobia bacterium]|jgi:dihydroxy-acid dehydratase|nr:dihydroxy-acid dehydratase [Verrucomicrobiota bacterium]
MSETMNWNSKQLTRGWQKGVTSFYWGLGFDETDLDKAQVGIGVPLLDGNLCNVHAHELGMVIAEGCRKAGLLGFPFGVPGVSDNITQGMEGGNASLPSRNLIANASECVVSAHCYDAMIGTHHCDKNGPGFAMALARMNVPGLILSGGSIMPGCYKGKDVTILDSYDAQAAADVGEIPESEADAIIKAACPGPGGCGIAASFNTWGIAMEAIGLMPPYSSSIPAIDPAKKEECLEAGNRMRHLLELNIRPRDILSRTAFENASATIAAIGGSTNGIIHLIALAREAKVDFTLKDIQAILRKTPVLCSFAPRGIRTMVDLHRLGGTPMLLRHLLEAGILNGTTMTVTGKTLAENLEDAPRLPDEQDLIATTEAPFKPYADMQICFGNLAPEGMVFKVSSMQSPTFKGTAMCFEDPRDIIKAVKEKRLKPGTVVILRNLGPVASGMPEVLVATSALSVPELDGKVALVSDTRVSGVSHGAIGVHCSPEAAVGGPIGLVKDGDVIEFNLMEGSIHMDVSDDELSKRSADKTSSKPKYIRGYLSDFAHTVTQAHEGCVSQWVLDQ